MAQKPAPTPSSASNTPLVTRRSLLIGAGAAGGLAVAWSLWPRETMNNLAEAENEHIFNAFLKISDNGMISCIVPQCEMGQGVTTLLPQIMADELGADWRTIAVASAPINPAYTNILAVDEDSALVTPRALLPDAVQDVGQWVRREWAVRHALMLTVGDTDVRMFEGPCRDAAAQTRALLMMAAARRWDVDWMQCDTAEGFVTHGEKKLRFADVARDAALLTPPEEPIHRTNNPDPLVGKPLTRLDLPAKVDGSANYAGDIRLPGLVYAAVRQGPMGDTRLKNISREKGMKSPDLLHIVTHDNWLATVARNWWAANQALDQFAPKFESDSEAASTQGINAALDAALKRDATRMISEGDVEDATAGRRLITATYQVHPALHAPIETRTATASVEGERLRIWVATQAPSRCRAAIAKATGMGEHQISLFPMMAGGSFDACLDHSVAVQAAIIARKIKRPVQLCWSRAEEMSRQAPRPPAKARMRASLNKAGGIHSLQARIAVPSVTHEGRARLIDLMSAAEAMKSAAGAADAGAVAGAKSPYSIPHHAVDHCPADIQLPTARWRGGADSYTVFFNEAFIDELAAAGKLDPLSYRIAMLGHSPALAKCLLSATSLAGWNGGEVGSAQGLACHSMNGSHIALVATARLAEGGLAVEQMVAVVDAGRQVNPEIARQQIEGGLIFGLAATLGATTPYKDGTATARNLQQLNLPTLAQTPEIIIEFIESDREGGGVGEVAVPVVAPALANALYAAKGSRLRQIPFTIPNAAKVTSS